MGCWPQNCVVIIYLRIKGTDHRCRLFPGAVIKTPDDCHGKFGSLRKIAGLMNDKVITYLCQGGQSTGFPPALWDCNSHNTSHRSYVPLPLSPVRRGDMNPSCVCDKGLKGNFNPVNPVKKYGNQQTGQQGAWVHHSAFLDPSVPRLQRRWMEFPVFSPGQCTILLFPTTSQSEDHLCSETSLRCRQRSLFVCLATK